MKTSRLFRSIWRINSVLILIVGLMGAGLLSYGIITFIKDATARRYRDSVVNVDSGQFVNAEWKLSGFERVQGTDYLRAHVYSKQSYEQGYYEKEASATRNYLFVNGIDKTSHWLIDGNEQLILNSFDLPERNGADGPPVKWTCYEVVKSDSNHDGRLTESDGRILAVADGRGLGYKELFAGIDAVLGHTVRDDAMLLYFYSSGSKNLVSEVSLADSRVTVTKELPALK